MVWIVLVCVGLFFMIGVAIHHARVEKIQTDCQEYLDRLRGHHDELMRVIESKNAREMREKLKSYDAIIEEAAQKLADEQRIHSETRRNSATIKHQLESIQKENEILSRIIENVRNAVA
jgi:hypothetical protein